MVHFWSWMVHGTWTWSHFHGLLASFNLHLVFVICSLSPLSYNLLAPCLVNTLIMVDSCQPGMCQVIMTSFSWSSHFVKFTSSFCDEGNFSIAIQHRNAIFGVKHWPWKIHASQSCAVWLWPHFHVLLTVKFMLSFHDYVSFSITIQPRLTIFDPHINHGG